MAQKLLIGGLSLVKKFNGQALDGRPLKVELAKPAGLADRSRGGGFKRSRW